MSTKRIHACYKIRRGRYKYRGYVITKDYNDVGTLWWLIAKVGCLRLTIDMAKSLDKGKDAVDKLVKRDKEEM